MKRLIVTIAVLLTVAAIGASAAGTVKPDTVQSVFQSWDETVWTVGWNRGNNGALTIEDTAEVDGHTYRISISGTENSVHEVTLIGWYADMKMLSDGDFMDGLHIYNNLMSACMEFLPDEDDLYTVFNAYDIHPAVREGSDFFSGDYGNSFGGWTLVPTPPGCLEMRYGSSTVEARRMDDGRFRFTVTF